MDENDLCAATLAKKIGQNIEQIFKTLVLRGDKTGVFAAIIAGNAEVDLKKATKISGNKNCAMVQQKELLGLTGYIRGGCPPLGIKKTLSGFYSLNLPILRIHFCKRRTTRVTTQDKP